MPDDSPPPSTGPQHYGGVERRQHSRTPAAPKVVGRARVRPEHARHALSLAPSRWYQVTEQPSDILTPPLEGYVWIDLDGRPRSVWAAFLEVEWA